MPLIHALLLMVTTLYQAIASWHDDQRPPPGQRIDVGGYQIHLYGASAVQSKVSGSPTIVLEHSLGGIEGYLLMEDLAQIAPVYAYDRAGYGWSDHSPYPRTTEQIVTELDTLLTQAGIAPPYLLIGDSFGGYTVRLYAHRFPHKVVGLVLTDALHESGMLHMPPQLHALKLLFTAGFGMSILGSALGLIRLLSLVQGFEWLKPELRYASQIALKSVKYSFCRPKHWITMAREMIHLDTSGRQMQAASSLGRLPIVSIKAQSFFKPSLWTYLIPLQAANQLRERMHHAILQVSSDCVQLEARESGHFVWIDQPDLVVEAARQVLDRYQPLV